MAKVKEDRPGYYIFRCRGCQGLHVYGPGWIFNGNLEAPTFMPSLLNTWDFGELKQKKICHLFVKDGQIEYLSDCTHSLAGKTVSMIDV